MDQTKIYASQLVAEVLSQMQTTGVNSLAVYDRGLFIGKITQEELLSFLNHNESSESIYSHKLNFDIGTVFRLIKRIKNESPPSGTQNILSRQVLIGISTIAAVALLFMGITKLFIKQDNVALKSVETFNAPDKNKLTLTFANGKSVLLNDTKTGLIIGKGSVRYDDGSQIPVLDASMTKNAAMILTVPRKELYHIVLPDGSKVWLNSASMLRFPATFEGASKRRVELIGEAYFEIAKVTLKLHESGKKNQKMPFIVVTDKQEIEVLGTHFNVSAYRDEKKVKTTLIEGSVRVKPFAQSDHSFAAADPVSLDPMQVEGGKKVYGSAVILKPNQQATLAGASISVKNVDSEEALAWKDGDYIFRNTSLESIMRMVARWYDVEIIYQHKNAGAILLGGTISKSSGLSDVLKMLELTADIHFKVEGKRITVIE